MATTTDLIEIDEKSLASIEEAVQLVSLDKLEAMPAIRRTMVLAKGVQQLRQLISGQTLKDIMALRGTKLGFRTDKDSSDKPYPDGVIRDALIEGMIRGAYPVMNEINVIGGNCYLTKEYFRRRLSELEGLENLRITEGVPVSMDGGALVEMHASWNWEGTPDELHCVKTDGSDTRICVRVNTGMGADAILGKATRKLYARIYARITGSKWAQQEAERQERDDVIDVTPEPTGDTWRRLPIPDDWKRRLRSAETVDEVEGLRKDFLEECDGDDRDMANQACDGRKGEL